MTPARAAGLEETARNLFGPGIAAACLDPRLRHSALMPEEKPAIAAAVDRRRREYTAGRVAARRAMARLGLPGRAVASGPDRAPLWPEGITGSISHMADACIAVAARTGAVRSLGVDLEPDAPLEADLWDSICTAGELAWLGARPDRERGRLARLIFSAKECAYKCQYPLTGMLLGFVDLHIDVDSDGAAFEAVFLRSAGEFAAGARLPGRFCRSDGLFLTAMTLSRPARA